MGGGAEGVACEARMISAGPKGERRALSGCGESASTESCMQLGAVDQRRIAAVRTQGNRLREVRHGALHARSSCKSGGALAIDPGQNVGGSSVAVVGTEGFHQHRVVRV